jgi:hypothetical protein
MYPVLTGLISPKPENKFRGSFKENQRGLVFSGNDPARLTLLLLPRRKIPAETLPLEFRCTIGEHLRQ